MTEFDWNSTWGLFASLWPRVAAKCTDEEAASYRRVLDRCTANHAAVILRTLKDTSDKFPTPAAIYRRIAAQSEIARGAEREKPSRTWPDQIRNMPGNGERTRGMDDLQVVLMYERDMAASAARIYGAESKEARRRRERIDALQFDHHQNILRQIVLGGAG